MGTIDAMGGCVRGGRLPQEASQPNIVCTSDAWVTSIAAANVFRSEFVAISCFDQLRDFDALLVVWRHHLQEHHVDLVERRVGRGGVGAAPSYDEHQSADGEADTHAGWSFVEYRTSPQLARCPGPCHGQGWHDPGRQSDG